MSGFPVAGEKATVTCATATSDLLQLLGSAVGPCEGTINLKTLARDATPLSTSITSMVNVTGLRSGETQIRAYYPQTTARIGNTALITAASVPLVRATEWEMTIEVTSMLDITPFAATAPTWIVQRPSDLIKWSGSYVQLQESGTAGPTIPAAGSSGVAYSFALGFSGTDTASLDGTVFRLERAATFKRGDLIMNRINFTGTGNLTNTVTGTAYPGLLSATTAAIGTPSWDLTTGDGIPDVRLDHQLYTNRQLQVAACWDKINVKVRHGELVELNIHCPWLDEPTTITA